MRFDPESDEVAGSWSALLGRQHGAVTAVLAGGVALHAVNVYLVTAMLPSVVAEIGGLRLYAWATTVFVLASVVASVLVPRLLAATGPRGGYGWALGLFAVGTVACAAAPQIAVLLAGRTLQGAGGGLLFGLSYAMIRSRLPEPLWPRGNALVSAMWGVGTLLGPTLGGFFAQLGLWRVAFLVLVPVAAGLALLLPSTMPARPATTAAEASTPATATVNLALITLAVLAVSATSLSSHPEINLPGIAAAVALIGLVLVRERNRAPRILPRQAFAPGSALPWLYLMITLLVIATTVETFVPLFGQRLAGLTPLAAGFLGAAIAAGWTIGSLLSASAHRVRLVLITAPVLTAAGLAGLATTVAPDAGPARALLWAVLLLLAGVGVGISWPHLTTTAMGAADTDDEAATAAASITTVQLVAAALGSALAGTVVNLAGLGDTPASAATALYTAITVLVVLAIPVAYKTAGQRRALR